ncbi:methionine synthase [Sesbania bispinosa]|nr:methionine synthase [Sesbania bispinosa]
MPLPITNPHHSFFGTLFSDAKVMLPTKLNIRYPVKWHRIKISFCNREISGKKTVSELNDTDTERNIGVNEIHASRPQRSSVAAATWIVVACHLACNWKVDEGEGESEDELLREGTKVRKELKMKSNQRRERKKDG